MKLQDAIALIHDPVITQQPNARWADLGCGTGFFTFALANLLQKGSFIYAVDKAAIALQPLPNPRHISILTSQLDFTKEPLPQENLDGILMANSFHYVADKPRFIAAIEKKLASSGIFLLVEYDTDKPNHWVPYPVNAHSLEQVFKKAGFLSFTKLRAMPSAYNTGDMYAAIIKS